MISGWFDKISKRFLCVHWEKFYNINDTLKRVIVSLVNWHFSTGILKRIAPSSSKYLLKCVNFLGSQCFDLLNVSHMLQNFIQCNILESASVEYFWLHKVHMGKIKKSLIYLADSVWEKLVQLSNVVVLS